MSSERGLQDGVKQHSCDTPLRCKECFKAFKARRSLRIHTQTHAALGRVYKCLRCRHKFSMKMNWLKHMKAAHGTDMLSEQFAKCEGCLQQYHGLWTETTRYQCEKCHKTFNAPSGLTRHLKKHVTDDQYRCVVCQREFSSLASLNLHMNWTHCDNKPYQCSLCVRGFMLRHSFVRHMENHAEPRNSHQCVRCGQQHECFRSLLVHLDQHWTDCNNKQSLSQRLKQNPTDILRSRIGLNQQEHDTFTSWKSSRSKRPEASNVVDDVSNVCSTVNSRPQQQHTTLIVIEPDESHSWSTDV